MGVPKFYRWISERYPNISRVINDNQIPDFDNFYLDMNGIIHACSHVNEDSCETNITEEEIFRNIFHYIDFLFRMIKPKKVFFMAVDGVAPRAKMNQQRSRRFRAGRDRTKKLKALAEKTGQTLKEAIASHFDTNAITPGTTFMNNLDEQLRYFIHVKLTTDPLWEGVDIHLSGHLTPGEGEHKIMEYIRYTRSQSNYNINTRHCLYGLDADLIMLGLVTHEMHFALLREEVKYGTKKSTKIPAPEDINWHLLQLCLLRDYIDLEFRSVKDKLKFPYDLEAIIDDWILMGYLVGNDFIPHLPHVHINQEALPLLWNTYKKVLPIMGGYMNQSGELNLTRFEIYLTELAKYDYERFEKELDSSKRGDKSSGTRGQRSQLDKDQPAIPGFKPEILEKLKITRVTSSVVESSSDSVPDRNGQMIDKFIDNERKSLNANSSSSPQLFETSRPLGRYIDDDDDNTMLLNRDNGSDTEEDKTANSATGTPQIHTQGNVENFFYILTEFQQHKNQYYREKMKIYDTTPKNLQVYVNQYIEALQWILKYYYQGCPSWSWFFPHHYTLYLSDLKNFKDLQISFQRGTPFKPFEQLLAVLPPTSRYLLPKGLQCLMTDVDSPLLSFYPEDFQLDQNEKKQDWEAIVLLPFIDEQLLLTAIQKYYQNLTNDERVRNQHVGSSCFQYSSKTFATTGILTNNPYFPSLKETKVKPIEYPMDYYRPDGLIFNTGRFEERNMKYFPKFPILNALSYQFDFKKGAVEIFESHSRSTTLVLNLTHRPDPDLITYNEKWTQKDSETSAPFQITNRQGLVERYLGKCIFVNWPHFEFGVVCAISDFHSLYVWSNMPGGSNFQLRTSSNEESADHRGFIQNPIYVSRLPFELPTDNLRSVIPKKFDLDTNKKQMEYTKAININRRYEIRQGVNIGPIPVLLYVCPLIGYRTACSSISDKCTTNMCFSNHAYAYPLQTSVLSIPNYRDDLYSFPKTLAEYFRPNDKVFSLQTANYSSLGNVQNIVQENNKNMIECCIEPSDVTNQPDLHALSKRLSRYQINYWTAQQVAEYLRTMPSVISKISGSIIITSSSDSRRDNANHVNVGFSWKGNKPLKQLYGYTKKQDQVWLYSDDAVLIISDYMLQFPEIVEQLVKRPKEESYPEISIWPTKGKSRLQELRSWIKKLPTYSMPLITGTWKVLDKPVIQEIDRITKSHKNAAKNTDEKSKVIRFEPNRLFKAEEYLGMCDADMDATYELYDRVVTIRLGTGISIGSRGTIIGILHGQTHLETYYEVLFDHVPKTSLDAILLSSHQQQCRIKVHSYHLLNYSHSLRMRPMLTSERTANSSENVWETRLNSGLSQQLKILSRETTEKAQQDNKKTSSAVHQEKPRKNESTVTSLKERSPPAKVASAISTSKSNPVQILSKPTAIQGTSPTSVVPTNVPQTGNFKSSELKSIETNLISQLTPKSESGSATKNDAKNVATSSLLMRAIQDSQQMQPISTSIIQEKPIPMTQSPSNVSQIVNNQSTPRLWQPPTTSIGSSTVPAPIDVSLNSGNQSKTTSAVPSRNMLLAQAMDSMARSPPASMIGTSAEAVSNRFLGSMQSTTVQQQLYPSSSSILQQAIQQSGQLNTNVPLSALFPDTTSKPAVNISMNTRMLEACTFVPGVTNFNPVPILVQQQQTPVRQNKAILETTPVNSSPANITHSSPSSQTQGQQVTSPRAPGGSTLQFVPSQVLRNMPKTHK